MKTTMTPGILIITIFIVIFLVLGYASGTLALFIKPTATIDSVTKGSSSEYGTELRFNVSISSIVPFQMLSGPDLSCTFSPMLLNSPVWKFNDTLIYNCPMITNRFYEPGTYN